MLYIKIGFIDIDGKNFPNLPIMKLSAYYKRNGCKTSFYDPFQGLKYPYDKVYASKVFTFTPDYEYPLYTKEYIKSGTGYDLKNTLLPEIENMYPDYGLYNISDVAYGFLSRGCPRRCGFCIVSKKEGTTANKVADLSSFWNGQRYIKLLDPNLLACKDRLELIDQLIESKAYIDFTQGLDIRLMTEKIAHMITKCKIKMIHFAWDREKDSDYILSKLIEFKYITRIDKRKLSVYVLVNFDTDFEFDLQRVYTLRDRGFSPYVMIYNKETAERKYKLLARWVNSRVIFRTVKKFEDYNPRLH